ncbi:MAG: Bax inhibitor-1/YccA family protein [Gammaproteobacteria bacterium]|nr:Bax inhibitor-1/YccA family protein [Gammaproteobacteria bacterium]
MNTNNEAVLLRSKDAAQDSVLSTNKLIRNTYILLSMTLLFSAFTAGMSMVFNMPRLGFFTFLLGVIGLFFLTNKLRNSVWGIAAVFALTGFMGAALGPMLNSYLTNFSNGGQLIMAAFGSTAVIFLSLSGYALTTRKDFSFMGAFLFVGLLVAVFGILAAWLFSIPGLQLAISAVIVLLMAGYMLYDTSRMVHGEETNYIMATVSLYVNIFNMFVHLLAIFGLWGDD